MRQFNALLALALLLTGTGCSRDFAATGGSAPPASPELLAEGEELYNQICAQCHFDGHGNDANPPLIGSTVVGDLDPAPLIRSILYGKTGVVTVNGRQFNGIMPAQSNLLDSEIAAISTYVRSSFAGRDAAVDTNVVAAERVRPPR
jgi:mono/diheme cytochrome c family protein